VSASGAPIRVSGDAVSAGAFTSATTGWAVVRADTPPMSCLLRTEDGGATWTCQLAWPGNLLGRLRAFDARRAALVLGLWPTHRNEINGLPVAAGEPFYHFVAGTQDAGTTWALGSPPDRYTAGAYFLTPLQIWLRVHVPGSDFTSDLARTEDGGATWSRIDGTGYPPMIQVAFSSPADGLLIEQDRHRADILHRTSDGGEAWTRQQLSAPPRVPKTAETWLLPVLSSSPGQLLTLRAVSRRPSGVRPAWEGTYAYARAGEGWAGPHSLPMTPASVGHDVLAPGPDGRLWGGSGHDVWVADDLAGPWQHRRVPLPEEESVGDLCPVEDGVIWLITAVGVGGGGLYRSEDDGVSWTRLSIST